jgi:two-component system cell cycle response regulator DivK
MLTNHQRLDGITVLVVDDDEDTRELLRQVLEFHGARVLLAEDGRGALDILGRTEPDLMLCDLMMPGLDGFGVMKRVREDPRLSRVVVVALTALTSRTDFLRTLKAGFYGHITKPFDHDRLVAGVERALAPWRHRPQERRAG